jgi:hypothetical protein
MGGVGRLPADRPLLRLKEAAPAESEHGSQERRGERASTRRPHLHRCSTKTTGPKRSSRALEGSHSQRMHDTASETRRPPASNKSAQKPRLRRSPYRRTFRMHPVTTPVSLPAPARRAPYQPSARIAEGVAPVPHRAKPAIRRAFRMPGAWPFALCPLRLHRPKPAKTGHPPRLQSSGGTPDQRGDFFKSLVRTPPCTGQKRPFPANCLCALCVSAVPPLPGRPKPASPGHPALAVPPATIRPIRVTRGPGTPRSGQNRPKPAIHPPPRAPGAWHLAHYRSPEKPDKTGHPAPPPPPVCCVLPYPPCSSVSKNNRPAGATRREIGNPPIGIPAVSRPGHGVKTSPTSAQPPVDHSHGAPERRVDIT